MILKIGDDYINLDNVTEIVESTDNNGKPCISVIFDSSGGGTGGRTCKHFYDNDARNLRKWLDKNSQDVAPKL